MTTPRRQHRGEFTARVALEAIRGERTRQELAAADGVHPVQIAQWKNMALEELPKLCSSRRSPKQNAADAPAPPQLSLRRRCALLGVARSGVSDQPVGDRAEDLQLMRLLDAPYPETPFYGVRRLTAWLRHQGDAVNPKHIRRLLRQMGLEAISPKPRLSQPAVGHTISPDLLRGVTMGRVHQVWSADITSIRVVSGVVYLVAVLDWFRRYVLSWAVSITMDVACCVEALEQALRQGHPAIFKTDQGAQLTSLAFTERLQQGGVRISMDGRGRALDHVCVERLWRSVKSEEV
jgi:putative transposase